ncbi:MAG: cytochrome c oxidase subunit II [Anaerolineae bacterium]
MHSPFPRFVKLVLALALSILVLTLAGCSSTQSILEPANTSARDIAGLFYFIFYIALVIFILVEGLLIFFVVRYQRRANAGLPPQFHGNTRIEVAWTLAPAIVLAVVFFMTVRTMSSTSLAAQPPATVNVRVIGHQWWWEFQYPDLGITTANDLHVPVGQVVSLTLESDNVIHSFWVPQLMGKTDVIPDHQNKTWLRAETASVYSGQCAEFCGVQHAHMLFRVVADEAGTFDAWVKGQQTTAQTPTDGDAARGAQIFTSNGGCFACHTINGVDKAKGKVGPNLTHFGSRLTIAAGTLPNTPENLSAWLHNPQEVKPGNAMNIGKLSDPDIQALIAYLASLK